MNWECITLSLNRESNIQEEELVDIITAELMDFPIEGTWHQDGMLALYLASDQLRSELIQTLESIPYIKEISYQDIAQQNWNQIWESSYQPIEILFALRVRALFHPANPQFAIELVIQPNMSFGTGHHATTRMILEALIEQPPINQKVLDMGCGTSILAILAEKLGAHTVHAVDNDPQCVINSNENIILNNCKRITVFNLNQFSPEPYYDLILANIQRQILIEQLPFYSNMTQIGSELWISGIESNDKELLVDTAKEFNFKLIKEKTISSWVLLIFRKY